LTEKVLFGNFNLPTFSTTCLHIYLQAHYPVKPNNQYPVFIANSDQPVRVQTRVRRRL